jgi:hypothetical protein
MRDDWREVGGSAAAIVIKPLGYQSPCTFELAA